MDLGTLNIMIQAKVGAAIDNFKKYQNEVRKSKKIMTPFGQVTSQQLKRIGMAMGAVTAIAGGFMGSIIKGSPDVAAAMVAVELAMFELQVEMGEHLAPFLENTFIPLLVGMVDWFLDLPDPIQEVITITGALLVAVGFLTAGYVALTIAATAADVAMGPVLLVAGVILAIIVALALLYTAWDNDWGGMGGASDWFEERFGGTAELIKESIQSLITILGTLLGALWLIVGPILMVAFDAFQLSLDGLVLTVDLLLAAINFVLAALESLVTLDWGPLNEAWKDFTDVIGGDLRSILDSFMGLLYGIYNTVVDGINAISPGNPAGGHLGGGGMSGGDYSGTLGGGYEVTDDERDLLRGSAEGARNVPRDMMMYVHRGEEVMSATESRRFRNQQANGSGRQQSVIINNTYQVGSILDKRMLDEVIKRIERQQKQKLDGRASL